MYTNEHEIKDMTKSNTSASYMDLLLSIVGGGKLRTFLYDKHEDFNFLITNVSFFCNTIQSSLAFYLKTHTIRKGLLVLWMFYSEGGATFE